MRRGPRPARLLGALALAATLLGGPVVAASTTSASARPAGSAPDRGAVLVRVDDVSPSTVARTTTRTPLRVRLTLTNTTGEAIQQVRVLGFRGDPIGNQGALDDSIGDDNPPTSGLAIPTSTPLRVQLPARGSVTATFATTISLLDDNRGVCQCHNAVYPLYLAAEATGSSGGATILGSAVTYVVSQKTPATPTSVSWVWPLIDRPHRMADDTVFLDDDLAASVSGGRLDRSLQVLEQLDPRIPITAVIDPELLDELSVMAAGNYRVVSGDKTVAGTGQAAARAWLNRLGALLVRSVPLQFSLTPYADPDVQSLTRHDLTWDTDLPTQMRRRVATVLAGREAATDVAWPASGTLNKEALGAVTSSGARTVVVDGAALSPSTADGIPVAVARLRTPSGIVTAAGTSAAMQRQVAEAVGPETSATSSSAVLPYLIAEIAVRSIQTDDAGSEAVLTPPRYVDPSVERAVRTITDTSRGAYAAPVALRSLKGELPRSTSTLRSGSRTSSPQGLPAANIEADDRTSTALPSLRSMLSGDSDAVPVLAGLTHATQRIASSAWRPVVGAPDSSSRGPELASTLVSQVDSLLNGVKIITPKGGSFTLGSDDSELPITVENSLPYNARIDLTVRAQDGLPGYSGEQRTQTITAEAKQTIRVPSRLERSGRIAVQAQLSAPTGSPLGPPVSLFVRSTVLGAVGIVITVTAGGVLALALVVRLVRRMQRLRRKAAGNPPSPGAVRA